MQREIDAYLEREKEALVRFLCELVSISTENPPGNHYGECADLLTGCLRRIGLTARRRRVPDTECRRIHGDDSVLPRYNVVGRWNTGAAETIHFNGHYDVVPAGDGWRFGAFKPAVEKGWVYGRGTSDMKGSLSALWYALSALKSCGVKPKANVEVSFTADEETDSRLGVGWLLKERLIHPDYAVVCEGGGGDAVSCGHNGLLWYDVIVHGRSAHGSRPELGVNAFEKMARLAVAIDSYKRMIRKRTFTSPDGKRMRAGLTIGGRFSGSDADAVNSIPGRASFSIDRRVLPNENLEEARAEFENWIHEASLKIAPARVELVATSAYGPCYVDPRHPLPEMFRRSIADVRRSKPRERISYGFNDMHFFAEQGIPVIGYGAVGENDHGVDERIAVRELLTTARIYARFIAGWDGCSNSGSQSNALP